jgi:diadenosine tetraphosphate (Ap4A) HIT family hydrolase
MPAGARTWPEDWGRRRQGEGCPMCAEGRPDETAGGIRFFTGRFADGFLQRSAPSPGYTIVVWRGRHIPDVSEMEPQEATDYWLEVLEVARGLDTVFAPCQLNYDVLGNLVPHVHTHIVPRYLDDSSPNMPLKPWEPIPVPENELRDRVAQLRAVLSQIEGRA